MIQRCLLNSKPQRLPDPLKTVTCQYICLPLFHPCKQSKQMTVTKLANNEKRKCKAAGVFSCIPSKSQANKRLKAFVPLEDALTKSKNSETKKTELKSRKQNTELYCPSQSNAAKLSR